MMKALILIFAIFSLSCYAMDYPLKHEHQISVSDFNFRVKCYTVLKDKHLNKLKSLIQFSINKRDEFATKRKLVAFSEDCPEIICIYRTTKDLAEATNESEAILVGNEIRVVVGRCERRVKTIHIQELRWKTVAHELGHYWYDMGYLMTTGGNRKGLENFMEDFAWWITGDWKE